MQAIKNFFKLIPENVIKWCSAIIAIISLVSFFHVIEYWQLTNITEYATLTAVAMELIILIGMLVRKWTRAGIVLLTIGIIMQGLANMYYTYLHTAIDTHQFKQFLELFEPILRTMFGQENDINTVSKRALSVMNSFVPYVILPIALMITQERLRSAIEKKKKTEAALPVIITEPQPVNESVFNADEIIVPEKMKKVRNRRVKKIENLMEPDLFVETQVQPEPEPEPVIDVISHVDEIVNMKPEKVEAIVVRPTPRTRTPKAEKIAIPVFVLAEEPIEEEIIPVIAPQVAELPDLFRPAHTISDTDGPVLRTPSKQLKERRPTLAKTENV